MSLESLRKAAEAYDAFYGKPNMEPWQWFYLAGILLAACMPLFTMEVRVFTDTRRFLLIGHDSPKWLQLPALIAGFVGGAYWFFGLPANIWFVFFWHAGVLPAVGASTEGIVISLLFTIGFWFLATRLFFTKNLFTRINLG